MEVLEAQHGGEAVFPWAPLTIMPIGDLQYSGHNGPADLKRLKNYIQQGVDLGAYFLIMGDIVDFASPSNRSRLTKADLYDTASAVIDNAATKLEDEIFDILTPLKGRTLGLVEGHHWFGHLDGTSTGQRLARFLSCPYGGDSIMMRITFRSPRHSTTTAIFVHHGEGYSATMGVPPRLERTAMGIDAQVFFIGHYHRLGVYPYSVLKITSKGVPHLYHQERAIVLTGSYLRGWMQGSNIGGRAQGSYVEKAMMRPVMLGSPHLTLVPTEDSHNSTVAIHGGF